MVITVCGPGLPWVGELASKWVGHTTGPNSFHYGLALDLLNLFAVTCVHCTSLQPPL
jgi:hypothetical protein